MNTIAKQFRWDQLERVLWTLVQAGIGYGIVDAFNWPKAYIPVIAAASAALKTEAAKHLGAKDTGATLPAALDPASPPANPPA